MRVFWKIGTTTYTGTVAQWVASGKEIYAIVLTGNKFKKILLDDLYVE